ncbi:MAG: hypothetical protein RJQ08_08990 [Salinisphaeraceae bacterium]
MGRSETRPRWQREHFCGASSERLPDELVSRIRDALEGRSEQIIDAMVQECSFAVASYRTFASRKATEPTYKEKLAAADQLANQARKLAAKLPDAGGLGPYLRNEFRELGDPQSLLVELEDNLKRFAMACDNSRVTLDRLDKAGVQLRKPSDVAAESLAMAYLRVLGERPAATTEREHSRTHPYVLLLQAVLEHSTGRVKPLTTIEHYARTGVAVTRNKS